MRKAVVGTKTMVVSPHYLASAAGARMLEQGGNAFDAAVAVSACLAVVYPHMTGLGGDSFWLTYHHSDGEVRAYNASGRSGYRVNREVYAGRTEIPNRGVLSAVTVPGMADGWDAIVREYGRLTLGQVLAPAIEYASKGFAMSRDQYEYTVLNEAMLRQTAETSAIYLPEGQIVKPGKRFVQADLAQTLRELAQHGRDVFYKGAIAEEITSYLQNQGGLLIMDDFADHEGDWVTPLQGSYRDYSVYQMPPNSQGFVGLMALHILENFDLGGMEHGSFEYYHLMIEALKLGFRDRNQYLTDPDFADIPLTRLLSKEYACELASSIRLLLSLYF